MSEVEKAQQGGWKVKKNTWNELEWLGTYLSDAVVNAEPVEQQGAEKCRLEQSIHHARQPTVHQERQRKDGIYNK